MGDWEDELDPMKSGRTPETGKTRYDSTAMNASSLSSDGIQGYAYGRQNPWFRIALEGAEHETKRQDQSRSFLQISERQMYKQLNRSSFYDEGRLFARSLLDFGTAVMFRMHNVEMGIPVYRTLHLKRCLIAENHYGDVDTLIRQFYLYPDEAATEFGYDNLPRSIQTAIAENPAQRFKFLHYTFPAGRFDLDMERQSGKEYASIYAADCQQFDAVSVDGYDSKPFFCSRFTRAYDGGAWGNGAPGMLQLSNIKMLNGILKDRIKLSQRRGDPPVKATEGMRGRIVLSPGGPTYVPPGEDFTIIPYPGDLAALDTDIVELRRAINEAYHTDFFLLLSQNMDKMKTATEAAGIQGEKAAMLAAFFGRLGYEFLEPLLEDLFLLELEAGRLPPPPPEIQGQTMKIDFISPLYQMQKQYLQLNSTRQALVEIAGIVQMQVGAGLQPDAMDNINLDEYIRIIAETHNMDRTVVRDLADVEQMRKARAQQQAAMMQFQMEAAKQKMENDRMKAMGDTVNKTKDLTPEQEAKIAGSMGGA